MSSNLRMPLSRLP